MLGEKTYCGVASHPGGRSDTLSCFMLRNRDRLLLGEPLGSSADCIFVFKRLCHYNCYKHIETVSEKHHHDDKSSVLRYLSVTIYSHAISCKTRSVHDCKSTFLCKSSITDS